MSGKEAAPAASVEINIGAITMEEDRSRLSATSRLYAASRLDPGPCCPVAAARLRGRVPARSPGSVLVLLVVSLVEAKYSECLRNEAISFGAGFSKEKRRNQIIIRRKLVLIRTTLIFV
jgi:hypothetical protein